MHIGVSDSLAAQADSGGLWIILVSSSEKVADVIGNTCITALGTRHYHWPCNGSIASAGGSGNWGIGGSSWRVVGIGRAGIFIRVVTKVDVNIFPSGWCRCEASVHLSSLAWDISCNRATTTTVAVLRGFCSGHILCLCWSVSPIS